MAIHNQQPTKELIVHSDRGSQYCSREYRNILEKYGFQGSMSKRGDCYDNAPIESFWGILKNELVHHYNYQTREEAKADIIKYIELFYNQRRIQKGLDFKTPNQMAEDFYFISWLPRISQVEVSCYFSTYHISAMYIYDIRVRLSLKNDFNLQLQRRYRSSLSILIYIQYSLP